MGDFNILFWPFETKSLPAEATTRTTEITAWINQLNCLYFGFSSILELQICLNGSMRKDQLNDGVERPGESVLVLSIWWWSSWIGFWPPVIAANRWTSGWVLFHWQGKTEQRRVILSASESRTSVKPQTPVLNLIKWILWTYSSFLFQNQNDLYPPSKHTLNLL